jgi:hypothetical protein
MGKKITVAINIMNKVRWLEEASHTSRLMSGWREEGRIKGNMLTPTVAIMPAILSELMTNARV